MKDKTGRPELPSANRDDYHDLEGRSLPIVHSSATRLAVTMVRTETTETTIVLTIDHDMILADCSGGDVLVSLPAASTYYGKIYYIKKTDGSGNLVKIEPDGSETIDDEDSIELSEQYSTIGILSDGSNWRVLMAYLPMQAQHEEDKELLEAIRTEQKITNLHLAMADGQEIKEEDLDED